MTLHLKMTCGNVEYKLRKVLLIKYPPIFSEFTVRMKLTDFIEI